MARARLVVLLATSALLACSGGPGGAAIQDGGAGGNSGAVLDSIQLTVAPAIVSVKEAETANLLVAAPNDPTIKLQLRSAPRFASMTGSIITLTPQYSDSGRYEIVVAATDGTGAVGYASAVVNVVDVKEPPRVAEVAPFSIHEGETAQVVIDAQDPDDEPLGFGILAAPSFVSLDTSGSKPTLTFAPGYDDARAQDYGVVVRVTNIARPSIRAELTITVTVLDTNRPPIFATPLSLIGLPNDIPEGTDAGMLLPGVDPDGDPIEFLADPANETWVSLDADAGYVTVRPDFSVCSVAQPQRTFTQTFFVRDSRGGQSDAGTITLTVEDVNAPPLWDSSSLTELAVQENDPQTRTLIATDPDGTPVTFFAADAGFPSWAEVRGNQLTVTPVFSVASHQNPSVVVPVPVVAVDVGGLETHATIPVRVADKNQPPSVTTLPSVTMKELETRTVFLAATDGDGDPLTYTAISPSPLPAWVSLNASTGQVTLTPTTGQNTPGVDLQFSVSDGIDQVTTTLHVVVQVNNTAPAVSALRQLRNGFPIDAGTVSVDSPTLEATLDDAQRDAVTMQAEVRLIGDAFDGGVTHQGNQVPSGTATVVLPSLPPGQYKWRARGVDAVGATSNWVDFPDNSPAFIIQSQLLGGTGVKINADAPYTQSATVTVSLDINPSQGASSLTLVELSEDNVNWTQITYASSFPYTLSGVDGLKTIYIHAVDNLGNESRWSDSITLDRQPPVISGFNISGRQAINTENVVLNFQVTDAASTVTKVEASNDGTTFTQLQSGSPAAWTLVATEGQKTVTLRATDAAGWTSTATAAITLDKTPPVLSSLQINGGAQYINQLGVTVQTAASDTGGSGVDQLCLQNGGGSPPAPMSCNAYSASTAWSVLGGSDGSRLIVAQVTDLAGNTSSQSFLTVTLDRVPPVMLSVTINGGAAYTNNPTVTLTETHDDAVGVKDVSFSQNGGATWSAWEAVGSPHSLTLLGADGTFTVTARARDFADQISTNVSTDTIQLDTGRPATGTISFAQAYTKVATLDATVSSSDALSGVAQVCVSASATLPPAGDPCWVAYATTVSTTLQGGEGQKTEYAWFKDTAGNVSSPPAQTTVTLDTIAPTISSYTLNGGKPYVNVESVSAVVNATDTNTVVSLAYSTNGGGTWSAWQAYSAATTYSVPLPSGDTLKSVLIKVVDPAGNETVSQSKTVTLDETPPATGSLSFPSAYSKTQAVTATVSSSDQTSGVEKVCVTTSGTAPTSTDPCWVSYASPYQVSVTLAPPDGNRTLYAFFRDTAGNVSSPAASTTIALDLTVPSITSYVIEGGVPWVNHTNLSIAIAGSDQTSGVPIVCFGEASPAGTCQALSSPVSYTLTDTSEGQHTVYALVKDGAGNASAESTAQVGYDSVAPTLSAVQLNDAGVATPTNNKTVAVTVTGSDSTSGIAQLQAQADGGSYLSAPYSSPSSKVLVDLFPPEGTKTVRARVVDAAGNVSSVVTNTILYDVTPPTGTISLGGLSSGGQRYVKLSNPQASLTFSDNFANFSNAMMCIQQTSALPSATDPCWVAFSFSPNVSIGTGDGTKTAYLFLRDTAGNVKNPPATDSVVLDQTPPSVPSGVTVTPGNRSLTVSWTASTDTGVGMQGYEVTLYRSAFDTVTQNVSGLTATYSGLSNGRSYQIKIRSYDKLGNYSAQSTAISGTPKPAWQFLARKPTTANLNGVAMADLTSMFVAGDVGTLRQSIDTGATWQPLDTGADVTLRFAHADIYDGHLFTGGANGTLGYVAGSAVLPITVTGTPDIHDFRVIGSEIDNSTSNPQTTNFYAYVGDGVAGYGSLVGSDMSPANLALLAMQAGTLPTMSGATTLHDVIGCRSRDPNDATSTSAAIAVGENLNGATRTGVILSTSNYGQSYVQVSMPTGYTGMALHGVAAVSNAAGVTLYAAGTSATNGTARTALITSSDCGATWTAVTGAPLDSINVYGLAAIEDLPATTWKLWLAGRDVNPATGVESATGKLLEYDVTGGTATIVPGIGAPLTAVSGADNSHVTVVGSNGYIALTDGTATTEKSVGALTTWRSASILEDGTDGTVWYVGDGTQVAKSTTGSDGGITFATVNSGLSGVELGAIGAASTGGYVYASERITDGGFSSRLYVSTGGNFTAMASQPGGQIHDVRCKFGNCFAVGFNNVLSLSSGGWAPVGGGPPPNADLVACAPLPGYGVAAVGSANGGGFGQPFFYVYAGPGATSGPLTGFPQPFTAIDSSTSSFLLIGSHGAVIVGMPMGPSSYSWNPHTLPSPWNNAQVLAVASGGFQIWYAALDTGEILKSTDNASSFYSVSPPTGGRQLYGLLVGLTRTSNVYAVGEGGTVVMSSSGGE